ncbi:hypothetical protein HK104_006088 [Borealophlyctis nickersoniae]|nr:hypothetical protein HK104_006088 [Borealophlyctis nickersoniae]
MPAAPQASPSVKIMQRHHHHHHHHHHHRHKHNGTSDGTPKTAKSIEEREAAYQAARARIFQEDAGSDVSQDSSRASTRGVSPTLSRSSSDGIKYQSRTPNPRPRGQPMNSRPHFQNQIPMYSGHSLPPTPTSNIRPYRRTANGHGQRGALHQPTAPFVPRGNVPMSPYGYAPMAYGPGMFYGSTEQFYDYNQDWTRQYPNYGQGDGRGEEGMGPSGGFQYPYVFPPSTDQFGNKIFSGLQPMHFLHFRPDSAGWHYDPNHSPGIITGVPMVPGAGAGRHGQRPGPGGVENGEMMAGAARYPAGAPAGRGRGDTVGEQVGGRMGYNRPVDTFRDCNEYRGLGLGGGYPIYGPQGSHPVMAPQPQGFRPPYPQYPLPPPPNASSSQQPHHSPATGFRMPAVPHVGQPSTLNTVPPPTVGDKGVDGVSNTLQSLSLDKSSSKAPTGDVAGGKGIPGTGGA